MKTLKSLALFIVTITIFSCQDTTSENEAIIEGKWNLVFLEYEGLIDIMDIDFDLNLTQEIKARGLEYDFQVEYKNDGTFESNGLYTLEISNTIGFETAVDTSIAEFNMIRGEYSIEGNLIKLVNPDGINANSKITELTSSSLIYKSTLLLNDTIGTVITESNIDYEYRFER